MLPIVQVQKSIATAASRSANRLHCILTHTGQHNHSQIAHAFVTAAFVNASKLCIEVLIEILSTGQTSFEITVIPTMQQAWTHTIVHVAY